MDILFFSFDYTYDFSLNELGGAFVLALNEQFVEDPASPLVPASLSRSVLLRSGDELAVLPPVSGG